MEHSSICSGAHAAFTVEHMQHSQWSSSKQHSQCSIHNGAGIHNGAFTMEQHSQRSTCRDIHKGPGHPIFTTEHHPHRSTCRDIHNGPGNPIFTMERRSRWSTCRQVLDTGVRAWQCASQMATTSCQHWLEAYTKAAPCPSSSQT